MIGPEIKCGINAIKNFLNEMGGELEAGRPGVRRASPAETRVLVGRQLDQGPSVPERVGQEREGEVHPLA
jgi:hypothetical protein